MRRIDEARKCVDADIRARARSGGFYGAALSGEGYDGGYCDALDDVMQLLNGVEPNCSGHSRVRWWRSTCK